MSDIEHLLGPDVPQLKTVVKVGDQEVVLDNRRLAFNETSLNAFMENLALWYDYFSQKAAEAEAIASRREWEFDLAFAEKMQAAKDAGATDKLSEAIAKTDVEVDAARQAAIAAKLKVQQIKLHLKAWDKAHDNAQSRGHMVRKEMDKLNMEIMVRNRRIEEQVDEIVRSKERPKEED